MRALDEVAHARAYFMALRTYHGQHAVTKQPLGLDDLMAAYAAMIE